MALSSNAVICSSSYSTARVQGCIASWAGTKAFEYLSFWPSVAFMCQHGCVVFFFLHKASQLLSRGGCSKAGIRTSWATYTPFRPHQKHADSVKSHKFDYYVRYSLLTTAWVARNLAGARCSLLPQEPPRSSPCCSPRSCGLIRQKPSRCPAAQSWSGAGAQCPPLWCAGLAWSHGLGRDFRFSTRILYLGFYRLPQCYSLCCRGPALDAPGEDTGPFSSLRSYALGAGFSFLTNPCGCFLI